MKTTTTFLSAIISLSFWATNAFAQDASLTNLQLASYIKTNTDYTLAVNVINNSGSNLTSCSVSWQLDGGTVNSGGTINIGGGGLPSSGGYYLPVTLSPALTTPTQGPHTLLVWVDATGDPNLSNDTITFPFTALTSYATKVVLLEEATAQWCEHCPPAGDVTDSLSQFPWIAISRFHNTDDFAFTDEETYFDRYYGVGSEFFPAGMVEMSELGNYTVNDDYPNWPGDAASQAGISPVSLTAISSIDTTTRILTVTFTANFKYADTGTYSFNGFILESDIVSNQTMPDLSVNDTFVHNNVVRALMGGLTGTSGIIPSSPEENTDYSVTYTDTIPDSWVIKNLSYTGVIFKTVNGQTGAVNAFKTNELNTTAAGIDHVVAGSIHVYPNPFTDGITLALPPNSSKASVSLYSIDGKLIFQGDYTPAGNNTVYVDLKDEHLAAGTYSITVRSDKNVYSTTLVKD